MKRQKKVCSKQNKIEPWGKQSRNEMEISNLFNKEFKVMVINTLTEPGRKMEEHNDSINDELKI